MTTEERLDKIEKELHQARRFNCWLLAVAGLAVLAWVMSSSLGARTVGAQTSAPAMKVLSANKFVVQDANGVPRAVLGVDEHGSGLTLCDEDGRPRAALAMAKTAPVLSFFTEKGVARATLSLRGATAGLLLLDENGKPRASLTVGKGGPTLGVYDEDGKTLWKAP